MSYLRLKFTDDRLPTSSYELVNNEGVIGIVQIRHKPSHAVDVPSEMNSHLYIEILPKYRLSGYGREALKLALLEAKKLGLNELWATHMDDNTGSKKIIIANGGLLVDEMFVINLNQKMFKYSFKL